MSQERYFTIATLNGDIVPLCPGGSTKRVTFLNKQQYIDACVQFRLHECDTQIDAIMRGLRCILPTRVLPLVTWSEFEEMVCGAALIDVDYLRRTARYDGCSATDNHVRYALLVCLVRLCCGSCVLDDTRPHADTSGKRLSRCHLWTVVVSFHSRTASHGCPRKT